MGHLRPRGWKSYSFAPSPHSHVRRQYYHTPLTGCPHPSNVFFPSSSSPMTSRTYSLPCSLPQVLNKRARPAFLLRCLFVASSPSLNERTPSVVHSIWTRSGPGPLSYVSFLCSCPRCAPSPFISSFFLTFFLPLSLFLSLPVVLFVTYFACLSFPRESDVSLDSGRLNLTSDRKLEKLPGDYDTPSWILADVYSFYADVAKWAQHLITTRN